MRACFTLASVVTAAIVNTALNGNMAFASEPTASVWSCDEFPATKLDILGTVTFLRDIECKEQTVMHVVEDLLLRSDGVLETKNIHFIVHEGVTMTLQAPAMMIARHEGSTMPLFDVHGTVAFEAAEFLPGLVGDSLDHKESLVRILDGGTVETAQEIRYYADSVIVSKLAEPGQELDATERPLDELSPAVKFSSAEFHYILETSPDEVYSTTPSAIPPISSSPSSSSPSSDITGDSDGESAAYYLTNDVDTPGGPGARDSAPFRHVPADPATMNAEDETMRRTASNDDHDGIGAGSSSPGASHIDSPTSTPTPTSSPIPISSAGSTPTSRGPSTPDSPTSVPRHQPGFKPSPYPRSSSNPSGNSPSPSHNQGHGHNGSQTPTPTTTPGSPGSHQSESDDDQSGSRNNSHRASGPKPALCVGWVMNSPALSESGNCMMWPAQNGSIMFRKLVAEAFRYFSGSERSSRVVSKVLVASAAHRVKRVFLARMALRKEEREGIVAASGKGAWGWLPWQRQHRQDIERARGRVGEVEMTLDNRACVRVSVDGTTVLSRSGSCKWEWVNRFPWRWSKNENYELYVTEDGFDVKLGERRVWGLKVG